MCLYVLPCLNPSNLWKNKTMWL